MEFAEQGEPTDGSAKSRQKRSRTGCLTCRTRRRKCDEGKPKCQSCISKGFECRYAAAFQILGKNNYTPEVPSKGGYTELQFVPVYNEKRDRKEFEKDEAEPHLESTSSPNLERSISPKNDRNIEPSQDHQIQSPSAERYEFALHGLLALGSANGSGDVGDGINFSNTIFSEAGNATLPIHPDAHMNQFQAESNTLNIGEFQATPQMHWPSMSAIDTVEIPQMTDERVLECFKHYRYNIAPWMDICDITQCFGFEVLRLSKVSPLLEHDIVALAEASINARHPVHDMNANTLGRMRQHKESSSDKVHRALLDVLETVKEVVTNLSDFWNQQDSGWCTQQVLEPLLPEINRIASANSGLVAPAVFWLMARLQLSTALVRPSAVRIPLPTTSISAWEYVSAGNAERVFRYAHDAVALCVDATIFSHGDEDRWLQQQYGMNRIELWKTLVAGFERWYKHRPEDFQPVIELYPKDGVVSEDEFPTLIFSSGATALANQLYHTGMLLLLQNKPRFVDQPRSQSPSMSVLWHAHRVCGISLNNDRWDCWDPCLVASLLVAAKTVTHQSQHKAILGTLANIQQLTGWNISYHVEQLTLEWQQADEW